MVALAISAVFMHMVFALLYIGAVYGREANLESWKFLLILVFFATPYYLILPPMLAVRHRGFLRKRLLVAASLLAISVSPILWTVWLISIITR